MLGAITGDIVGSRFEFSPYKSTQFELFHPECCLTDDSILTLATAVALLERRSFGDSYRDFYQRYPNAGYGARFTSWAKDASANAYNSYGNGSAMRVSPVAWFCDEPELVLSLAYESAKVTHNHPEGIKGAQAVALGIFMARMGENKEAIRTRIEKCFQYDLQRQVEDIRPAYPFEVSCQKSVPEAFLCFLECQDFESALRLAVSLGGDADTQAAIAGSLAEAYYQKIPKELSRKTLEYMDPFQQDVLFRFREAIDLATTR